MLKFVTTRQPSNPLNPVYKLSHVEYVKPDPPKFIRNHLDISDLEGARPKFVKELKTRVTNHIADIDGSSPKVKRQRQRFAGYSSMNYDDVVKDIKTVNRVHDTFNPTYEFRDTLTGEFTRAKYGPPNKSYGIISGSRPSVLSKEVAENKGMQATDIQGAQAGTRSLGMFKNKQREHYVQMPKAYDDIPGCKADTLKKSMQTVRHINPLDPDYKFPGHSEQFVAGLQAYGEEGSSMARRPTTTAQFNTVRPADAVENAALPPRSHTSAVSKRSQISKPQNRHDIPDTLYASQPDGLTAAKLQEHVSYPQ